MAGNFFGRNLRLVTFGESHGPAIGGVLEGVPAGLMVDESLVQKALERRRPGQSKWVSSRHEKDEVEFLSGLKNGISLGTPIAFIIRNRDQHPADYDHLEKVYRPSHGDYTWEMKYGIRDHRGGGRASARETVSRVVAGALASQLLATAGISVTAWVNRIGRVAMDGDQMAYTTDQVESSPLRCPDPALSGQMEQVITEAALAGDTLGGEVTVVITGVPVGLGEPVFDKLHADLAKAIMSINAVKGFEYGTGFQAPRMSGQQHNDVFIQKDQRIHTLTNNSGGIQGGISNGEPIYCRAAFKPVATLMKPQSSVDKQGNPVIIQGKGRHDVTVVPRAVPIVEAMTALVIADHWLSNRLSRL